MSKRRVSMMVVVSTLLLLTWAALAGAAQAATFTVTNTNDSGAGSLRQAILDANASPGADTIRILTAGTVTLSSALPNISDNVTILGPGASTFTIDVNSTGTGITIIPGVTATIRGMTITDASNEGVLNLGTLYLSFVDITGNVAPISGGGIRSVGDLVISDSIIENNSTASLGGGGLSITLGNVQVTRTVIQDNTAANSGGGIIVADKVPGNVVGSLTLIDSQILNNTASTGDGGGIYICTVCSPGTQPVVVVKGTIFQQNTAPYGGGLMNGGGQVTISTSTFDHNHSTSSDGAGGAIYSRNGTVQLNDSALTNNTSQNFSGGLFSLGGPTNIENTVVDGNSAVLGAGVTNYAGTLLLKTSTITNNNATTTSASVNIHVGGGVLNFGTATIVATKISGNTAADTRGGGGLFNCGVTCGASASADAAVTNSTPSIMPPETAAVNGESVQSNVVVDTTMTIADSTIATNDAPVGAGLLNESGATMYVRKSAITHNSASETDGGFFNTGILSVDNSTIDSNEAPTGGGVGNHQTGNLTVTNSLISNNMATGTDSTHGPGGGIFNTGVASLTNVTISGNAAGAGHSGGGIFNCAQSCGGAAPNLSMLNVTIANNTADFGAGIDNDSGATATAENTLLSGNSTSNCGGSLTSLGHNLSSDFSCNFFSFGDINGVFANIAPLADNGGPTLTHALRATSPAIDAGSNADCPDIDQRGEPRPADGNGDRNAVCDVGAYEVQPNSSLSSFFHPRGR